MAEDSAKLADNWIYAIEAGSFKLDGGAVFGFVPKSLWGRVVHADERNRVMLAARCLLITDKQRTVLIDCGFGSRFSPRERQIYGLRDSCGIVRGLQEIGITPSDIDFLLLTHLHFDHAGGAICYRHGDQPEPTFPQASIVVQQSEIDAALHPNALNRFSYRPDEVMPLLECGCLEPVDGSVEYLPGIELLPTPGHSHGHQSVLLRIGAQVICFAGDVIPTSHHVALPYILGVDLNREATLVAKEQLLQRAVAEDWLLFWCHDPEYPCGRIEPDEASGFRVKRRCRDLADGLGAGLSGSAFSCPRS